MMFGLWFPMTVVALCYLVMNFFEGGVGAPMYPWSNCANPPHH